MFRLELFRFSSGKHLTLWISSSCYRKLSRSWMNVAINEVDSSWHLLNTPGTVGKMRLLRLAAVDASPMCRQIALMARWFGLCQRGDYDNGNGEDPPVTRNWLCFSFFIDSDCSKIESASWEFVMLNFVNFEGLFWLVDRTPAKARRTYSQKRLVSGLRRVGSNVVAS